LKRAALCALLGLAALAPLVASDFQLFRLTNILGFAIALLGINILVGYNGQISLGHGAFYGLGAYATALLVTHAGIPHWLAIPIAGATCLAAGILFGLPLMRLAPMHLAMATFAVGAVLPTVAKYKGIDQWTGGGQGMGFDVPEVPFGLALSFDQWLYLVTLATVAGAFLLAANLLHGRIGRATRAIRDQPLAAQAMGIPLVAYRAAIFGVSAMLAGIAGALAALSIRYVGPGMFGVFLSFGFLIGSAVGGIATLSGALYGAIFLQFIFLAVGATAQTLDTWNLQLIYGVLLIGFLWLNPGGVAGALEECAKLYRRMRARHGTIRARVRLP
jgi:branched-chain amino acid transport system permease protein